MRVLGPRAASSLPALDHGIRGGRLDGQQQVLRVGCAEGQGIPLADQGNEDQARLLSGGDHVPLLVDHKPEPAIFKTQDAQGPR